MHHFQLKWWNCGLTPSASAAKGFPLDDSNLIVKAAKTIEAFTSCGTGYLLTVAVEKKIPIAAGMAGGSGNAAAALKAMQHFFPAACSNKDADLIASQLGSDINFCLHGGTMIGTNRGEILTPVTSSSELTFLLIKPKNIAIATPWIFKKYDEHVPKFSTKELPNNFTERCCDALDSGQLKSIGASFYNAFEAVCFKEFPAVARMRDMMLEAGCLNATITGSGPTLFGTGRGFRSWCRGSCAIGRDYHERTITSRI